MQVNLYYITRFSFKGNQDLPKKRGISDVESNEVASYPRKRQIYGNSSLSASSTSIPSTAYYPKDPDYRVEWFGCPKIRKCLIISGLHSVHCEE